jgi:hypothetical protein
LGDSPSLLRHIQRSRIAERSLPVQLVAISLASAQHRRDCQTISSITTTIYLGRQLLRRILKLVIDWREPPMKRGPYLEE